MGAIFSPPKPPAPPPPDPELVKQRQEAAQREADEKAAEARRAEQERLGFLSVGRGNRSLMNDERSLAPR
jgi:hypothetical protein